MLCKGGIGDKVVLGPGTKGCFPVAPEGWGIVLTMTKHIDFEGFGTRRMCKYESLIKPWLSGAETLCL